MKALKVLITIVLVLVVLLGVVLFLVNRYVQSDDFRETALATARSALGSEVKITDMKISLFSGITLKGITISNPQGFSGNLMEAEAFALHYRLLPLLQRKVEITELVIERPAIHLARNEAGMWNYDALGAKGAATSNAPAPAGLGGKRMGGMDFSLSALALNDAVIDMRGEGNKLLVQLNDVELTSSAELSGDQLSGQGRATIETINVADKLFARDLKAPVKIGDEILLSPLTGTLADGKISGSIALNTTGGAKYVVDLQVTDGSMAKLLEEAKTKKAMTGRLQVTTKLEGTGGLPTISGNGKAEVQDGELVGIPLLQLIGATLQIPELHSLKFSECLLEFTLGDNVMQTPVIRVTAPKIQITGKGSIALDSYTLNHDMTLAIQKDLMDKLDKIPKEVRAAFRPREDGYLALDFHVSGPYDSPKTDIPQRLVQGAAGELIQKGLEKLLK